jgi:hypothetical protein
MKKHAIDLVIQAWLIFGVVVSMAIPGNILIAHPVANWLSTELSSILGRVGSIERLAAVSAFPQVTRFFFTIMWISLPIQTLTLYLAHMWSFDPERYRGTKRQELSILGAFLVGIAGIFILGFGSKITVESEVREHGEVTGIIDSFVVQMHLSRFWLGVVGQFCFVAIAYATGRALFLVGHHRQIWRRREKYDD